MASVMAVWILVCLTVLAVQSTGNLSLVFPPPCTLYLIAWCILLDDREPVWPTSRWLCKAHSLPFMLFHFLLFVSVCVFVFFVCYVRYLFIHFYCNSMSQTLQVVCKSWVNKNHMVKCKYRAEITKRSTS